MRFINHLETFHGLLAFIVCSCFVGVVSSIPGIGIDRVVRLNCMYISFGIFGFCLVLLFLLWGFGFLKVCKIDNNGIQWYSFFGNNIVRWEDVTEISLEPVVLFRAYFPCKIKLKSNTQKTSLELNEKRVHCLMQCIPEKWIIQEIEEFFKKDI